MIAGGIALASVLGLILGKSYFNGTSCKIKKDLTGQVILITGANSGIGKECSKVLAAMNASVILGCRNTTKGQEAIDEIRKEVKNAKIELMQVDVSDLQSIKSFSENFKAKYNRLDKLVHNAGVWQTKKYQSKDGFESTIATNVIGPLYLNQQLLDVLKASKPSRIVYVSSGLYPKGVVNWDNIFHTNGEFDGDQAYKNSKLIGTMTHKHFNILVEKEGIKVLTMKPGVIRTNLFNNKIDSIGRKILIGILYPFIYFFTKNISQGSQTTLYCCLEEFEKVKGGEFYSECSKSNHSPKALIDSDNKKVFELMIDAIQKKGYEIMSL